MNTSPAPRRLLLMELAAVDAWPCLGVADLAAFDARILRGRPTSSYRVKGMDIRVPFPKHERAGSIYEIQTALLSKPFAQGQVKLPVRAGERQPSSRRRSTGRWANRDGTDAGHGSGPGTGGPASARWAMAEIRRDPGRDASSLETSFLVRQVEPHLIFGPLSRRIPLASLALAGGILSLGRLLRLLFLTVVSPPARGGERYWSGKPGLFTRPL